MEGKTFDVDRWNSFTLIHRLEILWAFYPSFTEEQLRFICSEIMDPQYSGQKFHISFLRFMIMRSIPIESRIVEYKLRTERERLEHIAETRKWLVPIHDSFDTRAILVGTILCDAWREVGACPVCGNIEETRSFKGERLCLHCYERAKVGATDPHRRQREVYGRDVIEEFLEKMLF